MTESHTHLVFLDTPIPGAERNFEVDPAPLILKCVNPEACELTSVRSALREEIRIHSQYPACDCGACEQIRDDEYRRVVSKFLK